MLNKDLKLNEKIFSKDVEQVPIRQGFGTGLLAAGEKNKNVVGLCADLTESTKMNLFAEKFPEHFIEIGVAEQNLVTVASGMAALGKIPYVSSYAMFSPGRNWEQIRTTIAYNDRKVIIAGSHAGISVGPDGGTHQAIEDIAIMRVMPNMVVISPCDHLEAHKAILATLDWKTPVYIRLAREKTPVMTTVDTPFEIGKAYVVYDSEKPDFAIMATGALLHRALLAAEEVKKHGIDVVVLNIPTIKPLDEATILGIAKKVKGIVSVEEHQVIGGLGSAISECLAKNHPLPMRFIGVQDKFGQSGTPDELIAHYGMDVPDIVKAVMSL
jgi:transketolase